MSEIVEALGGAAEGALAARAVEPRRGEAGADGHTHEADCLNCGTTLVGPHCHTCGQRGHVHRTIGAFFHDLLHGALHFEGKTWHTLPMLAWRPGELTRRYIEGERARFVSPMALFLFSVFLMFAVFQMVGISTPTNIPQNVDLTALENDPEGALAGLRSAREAMGDDNPGTPAIDAQIERLEKELAQADAAPGPVISGDNAEEVLPESGNGRARLTTVETGVPFIDHGIEKWRENPSLMAYKLQANSYKFSWLLIPLSIPFVWLIFAWRRKFGAYDHAVFVTYSLGFMSLLFIVLTVLGQIPAIPGNMLTLAGMLIPPLHIYKQLRGAYGLSRLSASWRTMVLLVFIVIILMLFLNVLLVLGVLG